MKTMKMKTFMNRNLPTVLSCFGALGVVVTSISASMSTLKARQKIKDIEETEGELTKVEKVKTVVPIYIPTLLLGLSSVSCIFGSNSLNKQKQAALLSAYTLVSQTFKEYKEKVKEMCGEEVESKIRRELIKNKYNTPAIEEEVDDDGKKLFYDELSGKYFRSTCTDVIKAEFELNAKLACDCRVSVLDWFKLLGIENQVEDKNLFDNYGWDVTSMMNSCDNCWISFEQEQFNTDDGLKGYIIHAKEPVSFDYDEYIDPANIWY